MRQSGRNEARTGRTFTQFQSSIETESHAYAVQRTETFFSVRDAGTIEIDAIISTARAMQCNAPRTGRRSCNVIGEYASDVIDACNVPVLASNAITGERTVTRLEYVSLGETVENGIATTRYTHRFTYSPTPADKPAPRTLASAIFQESKDDLKRGFFLLALNAQTMEHARANQSGNMLNKLSPVELEAELQRLDSERATLRSERAEIQATYSELLSFAGSDATECVEFLNTQLDDVQSRIAESDAARKRIIESLRHVAKDATAFLDNKPTRAAIESTRRAEMTESQRAVYLFDMKTRALRSRLRKLCTTHAPLLESRIIDHFRAVAESANVQADLQTAISAINAKAKEVRNAQKTASVQSKQRDSEHERINAAMLEAATATHSTKSI